MKAQSHTEQTKRFTPERLFRIRRLRKARRLFRQEPLFAYERMLTEYPGYNHEEFCRDLERRSRKKPERRKSVLHRYGRYARMTELLAEYAVTKDPELAVQAGKLRLNLTKPYRLRVRIGKIVMERFFPATVPLRLIETLTGQCGKCATVEDVDSIVEAFRARHC